MTSMFDSWNHILDGIILGDQFSTNDPSVLTKVDYNVSLIPIPFQRDGITYLIKPIDDWPEQEILEVAEEVYNFIENREPGKLLLINCMAGRSRSAAMVIYYMMKKYGKKYEEARDFVNSKRPIGLNRGFEEQLKSL